jgi:hypothetical protein
MLLRVLRWVAYSLRPLEAQELLAAVSTPTELDRIVAGTELSSTESQIGTPEDLLTLCDGLLRRSSEGTIRFVHESVKDFVQSPAMRAWDAWDDSEVHEMMAVVCLLHVACLDETAILRPWAEAGRQLREPGRRCYLTDYSTLHWHRHFRLAESRSMYLPSLLYQALQSAFHKMDSESNIVEGIHTAQRRIDQGLQFCCRHDFLKVGKMFLEMGAKTNTEAVSPVHVAAAFGSVSILQFLVSNPIRSDPFDHPFAARWGRDAYTPIELAALYGRTAAVELLLQVEADTPNLRGSEWASAYVIATEYGHQEVVRTFLKFGTHPGHTLEADYIALCLADELEHDSIADLIRIYRNTTCSDINLHNLSIRKTCSPAILPDSNTPQDIIVRTIESGVRNLDLVQQGRAHVGTNFRELDEFEGWSLVEHNDAYNIEEAHMDMDNG